MPFRIQSLQQEDDTETYLRETGSYGGIIVNWRGQGLTTDVNEYSGTVNKRLR